MSIEEPFCWVAVLQDGTHVRMGDIVDGKEVSTSHLDAKQVLEIKLFPLTLEGREVSVQIDLLHGERFIRFWRQIVVAGSAELRINVVGIQAHNEIEYRLYVFPDGRVVMSSCDLYDDLMKGE